MGIFENRCNGNIDRGYAWIVLVACFLTYMLTLGSIKSFGILYSEILLNYHNGAGSTASIGSISTFIQSSIGPLAISLATNYSFRWTCFVGGIFLSLGHILSSLTHDIQMWFVTYSLIAGLGYGFTYVPCATLVNFYFEKYRALAIGIVLSASGVGGFVFPYIYRYLIDSYGLRGAMLILGGIQLNTCVSAALFRQPSLFRKKEDMKGEPDKTDATRCSWKGILYKIFACDGSILRKPVFIFFSISFCFTSLSYASYFYTFPTFLQSRDIEKPKGVVIFSLTGGCEVVARVLMGWFTDLKILSPCIIFSLCMSISGVYACVVPLVNHIELYYCYAVVVGVFLGTFYGLISVMLLEIVQLESLAPAFAMVTVFMAVFCVVGLPFLGFLEDTTGSWDYIFYVIGALQIVSAVITFSVSRCLKNEHQKMETANDVNSSLLLNESDRTQ